MTGPPFKREAVVYPELVTLPRVLTDEELLFLLEDRFPRAQVLLGEAIRRLKLFNRYGFRTTEDCVTEPIVDRLVYCPECGTKIETEVDND